MNGSSTVVVWRPQGLKAKTREQSIGWLHRAGIVLASNAKRTTKAGGRCPHLTGRLSGSITHEVDEQKLELRYGSNVSYTIYQELGTSRIPGKHFLTGALQDEKDNLDKLW